MRVSFFELRCAVARFFIDLEYLPTEMKIRKRMKKIKEAVLEDEEEQITENAQDVIL